MKFQNTLVTNLSVHVTQPFFFSCWPSQLNAPNICFNSVLFSVNKTLDHNEAEDGIENTFAVTQTCVCGYGCVSVDWTLLH